MDKRFVPLLLLSCIALTGCVSKAEFDALEERVSVLEQKNGYVYNEQNTSVNENSQVPLSQYIKNWDEVIAVIEQEFGRTNLTIIEDSSAMDLSQYESSIKNFGNGHYYLLVDGTSVHVDIKQYTALVIYYDNGNGTKSARTPSYTDELYFSN